VSSNPSTVRPLNHPLMTTGSAVAVNLGLGALSSPFAATQFAQMRHWSFHYLISLGIGVLNLVSLSVVFGFKTKDGESSYLPFL